MKYWSKASRNIFRQRSIYHTCFGLKRGKKRPEIEKTAIVLIMWKLWIKWIKNRFVFMKKPSIFGWLKMGIYSIECNLYAT